MNSLRIVLIVIGVMIVAGIYLWSTRKVGRRKHISRRRRQYDEVRLDTSALDRGALEDLPESSREPLSGSVPGLEGLSMTPAAPEPVERGSGVEDPKRSNRPEGIVQLCVIPPDGYSYDGTAVLEALEAVGMQLGDMQIFHHHGVGEMRSGAGLFSLANMVNPGTFDVDQVEQWTTPGLVMFMKLPVPLDPQVAFELLLHTAQRLTVLLGGNVRDESRRELTPARLKELRMHVSDA